MFDLNILGILGIIVTILFGIFSIYIFIKRRYPGQITLIKETSLALFASLVKNFPELSIQYHNKLVSERVVFLRGTFLNTGAKDINETMVEKKLTIELPEKYKWLSVKIVSSSPYLQATASIVENKIQFTTGLFRCKEFFRFEALVEIPMLDQKEEKKNISLENELEEAIRITHRIADTQKEVAIKDSPDPERSKHLKFFSIPSTLIGTVLAILGSVIIFLGGWPAETHYIIKDNADKNIEVRVVSIHQGKVRIRGVTEKKFQKVMVVEDFLNQPGIKFTLVSEDAKIIVGTFLFLLVFSIGMWISAYREYWKMEKLRKLLSITQKQNY